MGKALVDLSTLNLEQDLLPLARIQQHLPQRFEFSLIDGVCHLDKDEGLIVAWKDFGEDDWWTRGHFPGRPLVPGILMAEGAAQVATVLWKECAELDGITIGFGGLESVRFRGQVTPPARMYFVSRTGKIGSRMAQFPAQAFVAGKLVFDGMILGVAI